MGGILNLGEENYINFIRCLTNLKDICNDVDIKEGVIRQRSNDKTSVFEMNMNSVLRDDSNDTTDISFAISDIGKKLDLLKTFVGQEVKFEIIDGEPQYFIFSDQYSSLKFVSPTSQFVDNKYMTVEELDKIFVLNEEDLILEYEFSNLLTDRIKIITQSFNTAAIQVNFLGEGASITAATQARDQFAKFTSENVITNVILDGCSANLSTIPFGIDHDNVVSFKMFKEEDKDISLNKFETDIGDVGMTIFTRSAIVKDEE